MPSLLPAYLDPELCHAIEHGNSYEFQIHSLSNPRKVRGRDAAGRNLLDLTLFAIQMNSVKNDLDPERDSTTRRSLHSLVIIGLHLLRQGLLPTQETLSTYLPTTYELANLRSKEQCSESDIRDFESFLIHVTVQEAPVSHALRLFMFAFWNPEHTPAVRRCYEAIVQDQCFGESLREVDSAVRGYFTRGDTFGPGAEAVVFRAVLEYYSRLNSPELGWPDALVQLRPVRRLLLAMLEPVLTAQNRTTAPEIIQEHVDRSVNLVRVCCDLPILEGFDHLLGAFAMREGTYGYWASMMRSLGRGADICAPENSVETPNSAHLLQTSASADRLGAEWSYFSYAMFESFVGSDHGYGMGFQ